MTAISCHHGRVKVRVAAPEPPARPTTGGVWIAVLVVVGTSVGMLGLAYDRAASGNPGGSVRGESDMGGPLVARAGTRRDGDPDEAAVPPAAGGAFGHGWEDPHADEAAPAAPADPESLADASRRVPIELYSATWCSACATAHRWLDANNIRYEEIDVDRRPGARDQLAALNPRRTLPTFDIDGDVLVGFDPSRLGTAISSAAARH